MAEERKNKNAQRSRSSRSGSQSGRNRDKTGRRGQGTGRSRGNDQRRRHRRRGLQQGGGGRQKRRSDGKWRVLVIGSGGREHALAWKLAQSEKVGKIYAIPGSAGMAELGRCVDIKVTNVREITQFAQRNGIDLTVVGSEAPLAAGLVDEFQRRKLKIYGPTKAAAQLEWSKSFAKDFMRKYSIPTASYKTFDSPDPAITFCRTAQYPLVIKADGLAAGKGVIIADSFSEATEALREMFLEKKFGKAGARVVIEDCLRGQEVSIMAFCDGEKSWPMMPAQDHKRIGEGDTGPNTGGMGAYAPVGFLDERMLETIQLRILDACVAGMAEEGRPYKGTLYAGLMLTEHGPRVLEFNCRFGDPETQVVLPLLESDLAEIMMRIASKPVGIHSAKKKDSRKNNGRKKREEEKSEEETVSGPVYLRDLIDQYPVDDDETAEVGDSPIPESERLKWKDGAAACVVLASKGYPISSDKGRKINGLRDYSSQHCVLFHAGIKKIHNVWTTAGGRVLGVTGLGADLKSALRAAYDVVGRISFDGMQFRRDIANQALGKTAELETADK